MGDNGNDRRPFLDITVCDVPSSYAAQGRETSIGVPGVGNARWSVWGVGNG